MWKKNEWADYTSYQKTMEEKNRNKIVNFKQRTYVMTTTNLKFGQ